MTPLEFRERKARVVLSDVTSVLLLALPAVVAVGQGVAVPGMVWAGACVFGVLWIGPWVDPRRVVTWDQKPLPGARLGAAALCSVGAVLELRAYADGDPAGVENLIWVLVLAVLGNAMPALRPNWFFGVRTPWTLRDDGVWKQTHRITGHLLVATSVFLAPLWWVLAAGPFMNAAVSLTTALALWSIAYSWWLWRQRPTA